MGLSVEDVLNELGWKDGFRIPVANEDNKRLEIEIEQKNKKKAQLAAELERTEERIAAIEKHATNLEIEHDYNQKLITAHAAQIDAQDHLVRVSTSTESALVQEIRNLEKERENVKERNAFMERELIRLSERIEESKKTLQFDKSKLEQLEDALSRKEDRNRVIENFIKIDAKSFKDSELEREKLTVELDAHRRAVVAAVEEVGEMEIMLDRTVKLYDQTLRQQDELLERCSQSLIVLKQRGNGIQETLRDIETLREISRNKMEILKETEECLDDQIHMNKEAEDAIKKLERQLGSVKEDRLKMIREIDVYHLELKIQTRSLEDLTRRTRQTRVDTKRKRMDVEKKRGKAEAVKKQIQDVRATLEDIGNQRLSVANRMKTLEDMIEKDEKLKMTVAKKISRLQNQILRTSGQITELESEKKILDLQKQGELKKAELFDACESREQERLCEKQKIIYYLDMDIEKCETRLERALGTGGVDKTEIEKKRKTIEDLEKLFNEKIQEKKLLQTQIANLEHDMRKVTSSLASGNEELQRLKNKKQDLSLLMEGGEKYLKTLQSQHEERQVEESILSLRVSQAERLVVTVGDKVYNLDKYRLQLEAAMKERRAEIRVHKEALNLQKKLAFNECTELRCAITDRKTRIENLKTRYDISIAAMGGDYNSSDGTPISTTYLEIQRAQERYLLQEQGDKLDATIRRTEHEIRSMENTLRVVNACNDKYKTSLGPVEEDGSEQAERQNLDDELYKVIETMRRRREQLEKTKDDLEKMRENYFTSLDDVEKAKEEKEKKLWNVKNLERQITEQKERMVRADKTLRKLFKDIQKKCESTSDETIILQEKDIAIRELQEQNLVTLQRITEFTIRHVEAEAYVKKLLAAKGITLPCAKHLRPSPSQSRCDTSSDINSERSRTRGSVISMFRESVGRIHNIEAEFSSDSARSSRKSISPAEQWTRSSARSQESQRVNVRRFLAKKK